LKNRLAEATVIVLSILLAFGLEAWWSSLQEADRLRLELDAVREEMRANRHHLSDWLLVHARARSSIDFILKASENRSADRSVTLPDSILAGAHLVATTNPSSGAVQLLINSGGMARVRSLELRLALAGWEDAKIDVAEDEVRTYSLQLEDLSLLMRNIWPVGLNLRRQELNTLFWQNRERGIAMPNTESIVPLPDVYLSALGAKMAQHEVVLRELGELIEHVDNTLELLDSELER
jgi:hypothetical protein